MAFSRLFLDFLYSNIFGIVVAFSLLAAAYVAWRRACYGPLRHIPGPRLAAMTGLVETYYDMIHKGGGQFSFQIYRWHQRYGPIIRINPWEVHIADPDFIDSIYYSRFPSDKIKAWENRFDLPRSAFSTSQQDIHRVRRVALTRMFSRARTMEYAPRIHALIRKLCSRLTYEFCDSEQILRWDRAMACLTTDVITDFCFGEAAGALDDPNFKATFLDAVRAIQDNIPYITAFPWLVTFGKMFPERVIEYLTPPVKAINDFRKYVKTSILRSEIRLSDPKHSSVGFKTGVEQILESDLPEAELDTGRVEEEVTSIVSAGLETTKNALAVLFFFVLDDADIYHQLQKELRDNIPERDLDIDWPSLERLPYLTACISEALRLSYGQVARSPRVFRHNEMQYNGYAIPAGTPISSETYSIHHHEDTFPDSWAFLPGRWLSNVGESEVKSGQHKYLMTFGRGWRSCAGINFAYCELFLVAASLFRRFDFELHDTFRNSVDCHKVLLGPLPDTKANGVRLRVKKSKA